MMPDTALAAVMQAWVPRFPAWSAASTWETWGRRVMWRLWPVSRERERSPVSERRDRGEGWEGWRRMGKAAGLGSLALSPWG